MSDTQVVLYVLALLVVYALAAKLDEPVAVAADWAMAQSTHVRCVPEPRHLGAPREAASASAPAAQPISAAC